MGNSIKRSMQKRQYEKFCEAWKNEKTYQRVLIADGASVEDSDTKQEDGTYVKVLRKDGQVVPFLGRKPTFKQWLAAVKNRATQPPPEQQADTKKVEVTSTDW